VLKSGDDSIFAPEDKLLTNLIFNTLHFGKIECFKKMGGIFLIFTIVQSDV